MSEELRVVLATTTFYGGQNELRFWLASDFVKAAVDAGYEVAILDGSPDPSIAKHFFALGTHVFRQTAKGMGPGRRELFRIIRVIKKINGLGRMNERTVVLWTEPEKVDVVRLIPEIVAPIVRGEADIVVPYRNDELFRATYPPFQYQSEMWADSVWSQVTGLRGGPMFGPVAFDIRHAHIFANADPRRYGLTDLHDRYVQHLAPLEAIRRGLRVQTVEVDFRYPAEQKAEEEGVADPAKLTEMLAKRLRDQGRPLTEMYLAVGKALRLPGLYPDTA